MLAPGTRASRLSALIRLEVSTAVRRPLFVIWLALLLLFIWAEASNGSFLIRSGDSAAGGVTPYITSEVAFGAYASLLALLIHTFFVSILAGLSLIRDDEARVGEILNATPLRPGEYIWGKFTGVFLTLLLAMIAHVVLAILFHHVLPLDNARSARGPFELINYIRPMLLLVLPYVVFLGGATFALGGITRQAILVFVLPIALVIVLTLMMGSHSEEKTSLLRTVLDQFDATGLRWLTRHYLDTDRGVAYYNTIHPDYSPAFVLNRLLFTAAGLGAVGLMHLRHAAAVRGATPLRHLQRPTKNVLLPPPPSARPTTAPLAVLQMRAGLPGALGGTLAVMRAEIGELLRQPGLYVFVPLMVLFTTLGSSEGTGKYPADRLPTSGQLASEQMETLGVFAALLLLAYTVETLERDRATRFSSLLYSLPIRTVSILTGKFAALNLVALVPTIASLLTLLIKVAVSGMPVQLAPFGILWGLLLWPALAAWTLYLMAVYAISGHKRYTTYGIGLMSLLFLTVTDSRGGWLTNPFLRENAVPWSDLSILEADRPAIIVSRILVVTAGLFFGALAVRAFRRREPDLSAVLGRRRFAPIFFSALPVLPFALLAFSSGVWLYRMEQAGYESRAREKQEKNYWKRNFATFRDAPVPGIQDVELSLDLAPSAHTFQAKGTLTLVNSTKEPMPLLPITGNQDWKNLKWTLNGAVASPEDRQGLYVFRPVIPLAPGKTARIGFAYDRPNPGVSRGGGSRMEFFEASAIVLTSFSTSFLPQPGYDADIGVDEDNHFDAPDYRLRFERKGPVPPLFGSQTPFTLRLAVTAPTDFTVNSSGRQISESTKDGRRTVVWESKEGIRDFNLVGGRHLISRRGKSGTTIYYNPLHKRNVPEMLRALDAARTYYSQWYAPFPFPELRLTEFPALEDYAQGFPGNISFSEGIGFLTKTTDAANNAFAVAAHESAHQWWGGMVTPGLGPGGNVISEGMAEFSATLLLTQIKGETGRQNFLRDLERQYGKGRVKDSEEPLANMSGGKAGDVVVLYQRGGWVFWMLMDQVMGRERMLEGLRDFLHRYKDSDDHPVLEDMLRVLRSHAPNPAKFDKFADIWLYDTSLPEFQINDIHCTKLSETERKTRTDKAAWKLTATLRNVGSGIVPIAVRVETKNHHENATVPFGDKNTAQLIAYTVERPTEVVIDPEVRLLQLNRSAARADVPQEKQ